MKTIALRTPYNYDTNQVSNETGLICADPSLTQQQFKDEADINTIVDRFLRSGILPTPVNMPQYVDYEGVFDFQSAMNVVKAADDNFMRLDAKIRARFNNSPQEFLQFFADPGNTEEAIRLGLVIAPQAAAVTDVTAAESPSKAE